jgi:hypothetical protein
MVRPTARFVLLVGMEYQTAPKTRAAAVHAHLVDGVQQGKHSRGVQALANQDFGESAKVHHSAQEHALLGVMDENAVERK